MVEDSIFNLSFITNQMLVDYSILIIEVSVVIIVLGLIVIFFVKRKSIEEKHAKKILSLVENLKQGKVIQKQVEKKQVLEKKIVEKKSNEIFGEKKFEISKSEGSLKDMLVKKFKPKIESQLSTKISVIDFNAQNPNFLALVEISGVKILLTLDSSGKIIDYKKVKLNQ